MALGYDPYLDEAETGTQPNTFGEKMAASFESGWEASEFKSLTRHFAKAEASTPEKPLTEVEAGNKYGIPFQGPTNEGEAEVIAQRHKEESDRQKIIRNGDTSLSEDFLLFGSGMAGGIIDPIGLVAGAATGFGASAILGTMANVGFKTKLAINIGENIAGNLMSEFGIVHPIAKEFEEEASVALSVATSVGAGVGLPLLGAMFKRFGSGIKGRIDDVTNRSLNLTEARLDSNKKANIYEGDMESAQVGKGYYEGLDPEQIRSVENSKVRDADYDEVIQQEMDAPYQEISTSQRVEEYSKVIEDLDIEEASKVTLKGEVAKIEGELKIQERVENLAIHCVKGNT